MRAQNEVEVIPRPAQNCVAAIVPLHCVSEILIFPIDLSLLKSYRPPKSPFLTMFSKSYGVTKIDVLRTWQDSFHVFHCHLPVAF